ncbi:MAG: elongation factor P--(R)-beta-lysine ligase [Spirochaetales bacterium]|nr:elongation factor P--(R)-beta-lysine ligase [Spirochaetales bacterium]
MNSTSLTTFRTRAAALRATREFFWDRGYAEIDTPFLAPALIPESTIEVSAVEFRDHFGRPRPLYLIPSPEVYMKRLLAQGSGDVFQITKCFRNGEPPTGIHHPEFTMLEWYTAGAGYLDSLALQEEYFDFLRQSLGIGGTVTVRGRTVDLSPPFRRLTMREAFSETAGLDLEALFEREALADAAAGLGSAVSSADSWESLFHKVFLQAVEPRLPAGRPLFILDYPAALPTLALVRPGGMYAERWELYIGGIEIANCYTEERDRSRIASFFREEGEKKRVAHTPHPPDGDLARIMAADMPASSGNALGFDRLLMVLLGKEKIQEVIPFAWYTDRS